MRSVRSYHYAALLWAVIVAALVVAEMGQAVTAANCNPTELSPCYTAITAGTPPTNLCCTKLRGQQPCLCGYIRNPALRQYVGSPNAKKVVSKCGVHIPSC